MQTGRLRLYRGDKKCRSICKRTLLAQELPMAGWQTAAHGQTPLRGTSWVSCRVPRCAEYRRVCSTSVKADAQLSSHVGSEACQRRLVVSRRRGDLLKAGSAPTGRPADKSMIGKSAIRSSSRGRRRGSHRTAAALNAAPGLLPAGTRFEGC